MEADQQHDVSYRVLGAVEAIREGHRLALGGRRQRALLALLLLQPGRPVSADRLIDELWAGEPPDAAETTLRSYVSRLRSALGPDVGLVGSADGYRLDAAPETIDSRRFEALIRSADEAFAGRRILDARAQLAAALELWLGRPYGELSGNGSLRNDAERLVELRLHAQERRLEADLELGLADELVDTLEAAVRDHPFRERLWRHLMLALYRAGRQADALGAYMRAREQLEDQLGIAPGEDLEELQLQILRHEVPAPRSPADRHNLPNSLTSFIGREAELERVVEGVRRRRLVVLTGVGGVGKTRLAVEAARRLLDEHPDGVWFVDLAPLTDADLLPRHLGSVLELREQAGIDPTDRIVAGLRDRELLLLLDNCEHLREAAAALAQRLLAAAGGIRILATSREVLGVPGEAEIAVPPLGLPASADAQSAGASEAVALLLERARAARSDLGTGDEALVVAAQIVKDLDGLPLAIELAAARARALSLGDIAARLDDRFRFLVSWRRLASSRHRTLREAMDWSYDLLGTDEQELLGRLSVFVGGFTLDLVANVCTDGDEAQALDLLEHLLDASLVVVETGSATTRYRLLETVRQYGAERLDAAGETVELRGRHARELARFAVEAWTPLRTAGVQNAWVERVAQERENLRAALAWSRDIGEFDQALRIAESMWWFWWIRGELTEGRAWLAESLAGAVSSDGNMRGRALLGAAGLAWAQGDLEAGERDADAARVVFEASGNRLHEGSALNTLGLIADGRGEIERSRQLFQAALDRFRAADVDPQMRDRNVATAIDNLGSASHALGEDTAAARYYEEALAINLAAGDSQGVAMNELHLATMAAESGRLDDARALLQRALPVYRAAGFVQYAAECLETVAMVANAAGDAGDAAFLLGASRRMRGDAGNAAVPYFERLRTDETAAARLVLGEAAANEVMDAGAAVPSDMAIDRALAYLAR